MSDTTSSLRRKIDTADDLQSVARTMKTIAASRIAQYEQSTRALSDYWRVVELGLGACFRESQSTLAANVDSHETDEAGINAIVFGSDQGLVGRFNETIADFAIESLARLPGKPQVWAVGSRVHARLADAGLSPVGLFAVPNSVWAIAPLVGLIQIESEAQRVKHAYSRVYVFHNQPQSDSLYEPVSQQLLPLDVQWQRGLAQVRWPTTNLPQVMSDGTATLRALLHEYLFISLFRACAESLASENASRLSAMQRAETNIDGVLHDLRGAWNRLRQASIDEEMFDVISGYEALA